MPFHRRHLRYFIVDICGISSETFEMIYLTLHKHHPKITGKSPYGTPRKEQPYGLISSPPRRPRIYRAVRRLSIFSVCAFSADPNRGEIKKMQNRRKSSRRRTSVRQRRFSAVEKAKTLFHLLKESARIPTAFRKSDYTKAVIKKLVFAFSVRTILADPNRGEIKKMQKRRKSSRRRTSVRQRRFSAVEKAKTFNLVQESVRIPTHHL